MNIITPYILVGAALTLHDLHAAHIWATFQPHIPEPPAVYQTAIQLTCVASGTYSGTLYR